MNMLKDKFSRQTTAFLAIVAASLVIYPVAQAGMTAGIWVLVAIIALAAGLSLLTK